MIIRSIFRRYERWNPVHPTSGAFWGVGIGIGCGVGWGPGFGPEVIGYVGAGCGAGFSVGITFFGIGIGLPSNHLVHIAQYASELTKREVAGARSRFSKSGSSSSLSSHVPEMRNLLVYKSRSLFEDMKRVLFPPPPSSQT